MYLADNFLKNIFHRDNAFSPTEFINDYRHVLLLLLQFPHEMADTLRFRNEERRSDDVLKNDEVPVLQKSEQVLGVHHANNIVDGFPVDRHAGITFLKHDLYYLCAWCVDVESNNVRPGYHYLLRRRISKFEDTFDEL